MPEWTPSLEVALASFEKLWFGEDFGEVVGRVVSTFDFVWRTDSRTSLLLRVSKTAQYVLRAWSGRNVGIRKSNRSTVVAVDIGGTILRETNISKNTT